ncbi:hypothetical protein PLESTB_000686000 [Pleodorina starrii]|uniref:Uncharacterized protein n=1 Tax=Pleodorina starrii TaxID=330485 RepID=A0A9W6BJH9_9CHLO|nr:hypothetical protein PLESTM_001231000 [Pleodorina starrii]GLC52900.1 hypothetical protein PLESTB_000686000 [Pleodorina starrii]GLC65199.1 hypothetical protein PLESTF_000262700 [Pleodorina starrii]
MPPKGAANAAPAVRQDLPWALGILSNPDADPTQLPLALGYLSTFNVQNHLPHDIGAAVQLLTLVVPFVCATDTAVNTAALRVLTRLMFTESQNHEELREALNQPASLQALWAVVGYFHASFDAYAARLVVINSEPPEPPPPVRPGKPDSRLSKQPPPPPVDPETTLPGPSKYALDLALTALTQILTGSRAAGEAAAAVLGPDVSPLLTVLKHHSSRVQVLALRLLRALLRIDPLAARLAAAGAVGRLTEALSSSGFGAVREEALMGLSRMVAAYPPSMQLSLDAGLPLALLKHLLAPTTGVPQEPRPPTPPPPPGATPAATPMATPAATQSGDGSGGDGAPLTPRGPPPIDFSKPVASSPERLQELSVDILLQLSKHHHGAVQALLRLGAMQLLLALLPSPQLPEPPPQEGEKRRSSASDTFLAAFMGRGRPSQTGSSSGGGAAEPPPKPREAWMPYLDGPPPLPLPTTKLISQPLQAALLTILSCLVSEPGVQDYWWHVHATKRLHLQLMHLLRTDAPPKPKPPETSTPSRRMTPAAAAAAPPPPPPSPPDFTVPPFPGEVRAAVLSCVLQLMKERHWLQLVPYLTMLQQTVRNTAEWAPEMVGPLAEILQRIMQTRLPLPPRAAAAAAPAGAGPPLELARVCNATANGLDPEVNGLSETELSDDEAVAALKELARVARKGGDPWVPSTVAAALLALPETAIYAPPWPPLPSPPPTPPPPPLPTSQYLWDALGRPVMTDGIKLPHL